MMIGYLLFALVVVGVAFNLASSAYVLTAIRRLGDFGARRPAARGFRPPVTILKPLCGLDEGLYENLASFCDQDYPEYQVVFGVREGTDPAVAVARRVAAERPDRDIAVVVDERVHGTNPKVSNLENMWHAARHGIVVIADSDMRVGPDYLETLVAPFAEPDVGAVTCVYRGRPSPGLPSALASLFINEWFLPSVLVSAGLRRLNYCFGATMAVRRGVLEEIGGLRALNGHLADDHMLGRLVSERGHRVVLSSYVVDNMVRERTFADLFRHELRWMRTVRGVAPLGHLFSFIMYIIPLTIVVAFMVDLTIESDAVERALIGSAVMLRVLMHYSAARVLGPPARLHVWLLPVRDVLSLVVWAASFFGRNVSWKDQTLSVRSDGRIRPRREEVTTV